MKHLLIIQNYNANKGDSSVIHAMKQTLLRTCNDLAIALTSYDPSRASQEYGVQAADWLVSYRQIKLARTRLLKVAYTLREGLWLPYSLLWLLAFRTGMRLFVPRFKKKTIDLYLRSQVVVLPGGHFFTTLNSVSTNLSHFCGLLFAIALRKRTMIYAETIGPFLGHLGPITRAMTHFILKRVDIVTVREKASLAYCDSLANVHLTGEIVFALETDLGLAIRIPDLNRMSCRGGLRVGLTIHHLYFRHFFSLEEYVTRMARILDRIGAEFGAEILIIPMEDCRYNGGDRPVAQRILKALRNPQHCRILEGDWGPLATAALIGNMDVCICTKTHSIVFALKAGVPTIAIAYQQKSREFMEALGVQSHAIDLRDLDADRFIAIFRTVVESRAQIRATQESALEKVRCRALENNRLLMTLFSEGKPE